MKIESTMDIIEVDNKEIKSLDYPQMAVRSHWCYRSKVVIKIDGKEYTVYASDIITAVECATRATT